MRFAVIKLADMSTTFVDPIKAVFQTNSWGGGLTQNYTSVSQEMDDIIWQYDFTIFQSQSNAGNQDSRPQAWAKNIVAGGAVDHLDRGLGFGSP